MKGARMASEQMTRDILTDLPVASFANGMACHMKNHARSVYGKMDLMDLLKGKWIIMLKESEGIEEYSSLDELLADGWVVD